MHVFKKKINYTNAELKAELAMYTYYYKDSKQ